MANSEDYTVVWLGVSIPLLGQDQVKQAVNGLHPLIAKAETSGLDHWFDTFSTDPGGEEVFSLLIGEKIDILGFKEGRSQFSIAPGWINERSKSIDTALLKIGLDESSSLHVLLRIQE